MRVGSPIIVLNISDLMKTFSDIVNEARNINTTVSKVDFDSYSGKLKGSIPSGMAIAMNLLNDYGINDVSKVDELIKANKTQLLKLSDIYQVGTQELSDLQGLLKSNKQYLRILPMYHSETAIKAVQAGTLTADDLLIDMSTPKGRNEVAKKYMPVVYKIVNQMTGKSRLSRSDLLSAALDIFANKMQKWDVDGDKNNKVVSFKTYITYILRFNLANEMGRTGHTLSGTNSSAWKNHGAAALDAFSLDGLGRNADGELRQDHLAALGTEDEMDPDEKSTWEDLYKELNKKFSQRDCDIFYSFFGLNGHKQEKNKDISGRYGVSRGAISQTITKIVTWLQKNPKSIKILHDLAELYNESLMVQLWRMDRETIMEQLINNDVYILLENAAPWKTRAAFVSSFDSAMTKVKAKETIEEILDGDFMDIDDNIKKYNDDIITFLTGMYPTANIHRISDIGLIDKMHEVQKYYRYYIAKKH